MLETVINRLFLLWVSVCGVWLVLLTPGRAQQPGFTLPPMQDNDQPTIRVRKAPSTGSMDDQLTGAATSGHHVGAPPVAEWEWSLRRFVNLGLPEPATLRESVRVGFVNRGKSFVRVTFRAKAPAGGFPAGSFRGLPEVSYSLERLYTRVVIRARRYVAQADGPFELVEADPRGHTLADFSTLGGIARGRNMVATVEDAFRGENVFAINGDTLSFVNAHFYDDSAHPFPAEIVLGPVTEEKPVVEEAAVRVRRAEPVLPQTR